MKLSKQAGAAVVASMTLASSSSAVSVWEELLPRPTRKVRDRPGIRSYFVGCLWWVRFDAVLFDNIVFAMIVILIY